MKIAIQTIVFNAESVLPAGMLSAWLKQAEFADLVLITEGATKAETHAWDGDTSSFTEDGGSTDGTISTIEDFIKDRPKFHLKKADGFWDGKTSMFNYWFDHTNLLDGFDYVWQIDLDEFYMSGDIEKLKSILEQDSPDYVDFFANHFWGDFNHAIDERSDGRWANEIPWRRIFKLHEGSRWASHEPPRMIPSSTVGIDKYETLRRGIKLFHYSYVSRKQAEFKSIFFRNSEKIRLFDKWQTNKSMQIFGCDVYPFHGQHPEVIDIIY
jgi:glycosyltransferase involved in cell wall biosynthesis